MDCMTASKRNESVCEFFNMYSNTYMNVMLCCAQLWRVNVGEQIFHIIRYWNLTFLLVSRSRCSYRSLFLSQVDSFKFFFHFRTTSFKANFSSMKSPMTVYAKTNEKFEKITRNIEKWEIHIQNNVKWAAIPNGSLLELWCE